MRAKQHVAQAFAAANYRVEQAYRNRYNNPSELLCLIDEIDYWHRVAAFWMMPWARRVGRHEPTWINHHERQTLDPADAGDQT